MRDCRRILIVDDDPLLRRSLAEQLERHGEFAVLPCEDAAAALAAARRERFDAVLLDAVLPDMDGRELCRLMRRAGVKAPIIILSGGDAELDCVTRAEIGATDTIAKPFRLGALLERLRAQIGDGPKDSPAMLAIGPYSFDPARKLMDDAIGRRTVRLTEKETALCGSTMSSSISTRARRGGAKGAWSYATRPSSCWPASCAIPAAF